MDRLESEVNKMKYKSIKNYLDFNDLKEKLGYKTYKPRIGNIGRALIKLSKEGDYKTLGWLKHQLNIFFKKGRQKMNKKKKGQKC